MVMTNVACTHKIACLDIIRLQNYALTKQERPDLILTLLCIYIMTVFDYTITYHFYPHDPCPVYCSEWMVLT